MTGGRLRWKRREREWRLIGVETKEESCLRQLVDILQMKYLQYGSQMLLRDYVILCLGTLIFPHWCSRSLQ